MKRLTATTWVLCALTFSTLVLKAISAHEPLKPGIAPVNVKLTLDEQRVITHCLALLHKCQLPDGTIVQVRVNAVNSHWHSPYFASHVALAFIASYEVTKQKKELDAASNWLEWMAAHQEKEGIWYDYEGIPPVMRSNRKVDAWDSSASMYLLVLAEYHRIGGNVTPAMQAASIKSLKCLKSLADQDGLTFAKPDYKVKYLMDNIESHAGLAASKKMFEALKLRDEAKLADDMDQKITAALPNYWLANEERFGWAKHPNGKIDGGLEKNYPHGLAQLFGMAFVKAEKSPWKQVNVAFRPEMLPHGTGSERWLMAASQISVEEQEKWRKIVVKDANQFTDQNVYSFRPALVILALLKGSDWMPKIDVKE